MSTKQIAWNAFKKTGDIETFLEFRKLENVENNNIEYGKAFTQNTINKENKELNFIQ